MLITSRGTGRWVMPKGNIGPGVAPHVAAATESLAEFKEFETESQGEVPRHLVGCLGTDFTTVSPARAQYAPSFSTALPRFPSQRCHNVAEPQQRAGMEAVIEMKSRIPQA